MILYFNAVALNIYGVAGVGVLSDSTSITVAARASCETTSIDSAHAL